MILYGQLTQHLKRSKIIFTIRDCITKPYRFVLDSLLNFIPYYYFSLNTNDDDDDDEIESQMTHFLLQEASITLCTAQRSPQQVLYQLYNAITMTELKGYAMMQFSYMLLKTYGRGEISLFV